MPVNNPAILRELEAFCQSRSEKYHATVQATEIHQTAKNVRGHVTIQVPGQAATVRRIVYLRQVWRFE
jgi:hypothetical protein